MCRTQKTARRIIKHANLTYYLAMFMRHIAVTPYFPWYWFSYCVMSQRKRFMMYQLREHLGGGKHCAVYVLFAMLCVLFVSFLIYPSSKSRSVIAFCNYHSFQRHAAIPSYSYTVWLLKMLGIRCAETSITNQQSTPRNMSVKRRPQVYGGGNLKSLSIKGILLYIGWPWGRLSL